MGVILRKACKPTGSAIAFARRVGLSIDGISKSGQQKHRVFGGYIITAKNTNGNVIVRIIEPPGLWVFGTALAKSIYDGYDWERNPPASDRLMAGLQIGGAGLLEYSDEPQDEADIETMDPNDIIYFPKKRWHNLGERVAAAYITQSALTENGGTYTMASVGYINTSTASSGYDEEGAILIEIISPRSTSAHWSLTTSDTTKTFTADAINQQQVFIRQNSLADVTNAVSPCLFTNKGLTFPYRTPYAVCIREIEPEIKDGVELPLRYRDVLVVIPYIDSTKPELFDRVKEDTGLEELPRLCGFTVVRAHMPYDYENVIGEQELEITWFKDVSILDSNVEDVVPEEYLRFVVELEDIYHLTTDVVPEDPESTMTYPLYFEGHEANYVLSMSYAVREPPLGDPPNPLPELPDGALPVNYDPAQLLVVQTTITHKYTPANGTTRTNLEIPVDPEEETLIQLYVSTRAYTFNLANGAYTEIELDGTLVQHQGRADLEIPPEDDTGIKFPVYYTYAAVGQAVPCVKIEVDTSTVAYKDKEWSSEDTIDQIQNYEGAETKGSTKFVLVYPGGTKTEFNLDTWCPIRPVMRGLSWGLYLSNMVFHYDMNDPEAVTKTITASGFAPGVYFFDRDPLAEEIVDMEWLDHSLLRQRTMRRFCEPDLCSSQKIAGSIGNGKIAILCCPMAQKETAAKLDWSIIVAYEDSGEFIEERGIVFEQQPLESSCWLSMTVQKPEIANLDTGEIIQEAVIVVSLQKPRMAYKFQEVEGYNQPSDNILMHLIQNRNYTFPRERVDPDAVVTDASTEQKISTDGGRTWKFLIKDMPGDCYYMGNQLAPRDTGE